MFRGSSSHFHFDHFHSALTTQVSVRKSEGWVKIYNVKILKTEMSTGPPKLCWNQNFLDPFKLTPRLGGTVHLKFRFKTELFLLEMWRQEKGGCWWRDSSCCLGKVGTASTLHYSTLLLPNAKHSYWLKYVQCTNTGKLIAHKYR